MCKHKTKAKDIKGVNTKDLYRRFGQLGNLDVCQECASKRLRKERKHETDVHRRKPPKTSVLH